MRIEAVQQPWQGVVGDPIIVATSKMYEKAVFFLKTERVVHLTLEKGLTLGGPLDTRHWKQWQVFICLAPEDVTEGTLMVEHEGAASRVFWAYTSCVLKASTQQVRFSGHNLVWVELVLFSTRVRLAYWLFNNLLLEDKQFWDSFCHFWTSWRRKRVGGFPSLRLWWDVGKTPIRVFCQHVEAPNVLCEDLLQVRPEGAERLNAPLSLEKLTGAINCLTRGKSLGLDGVIHVPGQSIHDNIHLVQDMIRHLSLNQQKVFDRADD
eukprot:g39194.t1